MDPVKILKRSWYILWSYRALWVFGLVLALAGGASSGGGSNNGTRYQYDGGSQQTWQLPSNLRQGMEEFTREMERLFNGGPQHLGIPQKELTTIILVVVAFVLFMIVISVIIAIARYVSETAVIRMVDEYESTETKMTVREGFRIGWSRTSWRLFLINLIVSLPAILLMLVLLLAGIGVFFAVKDGTPAFTAFSIIALIGMAFLLIFVVVITSVVLHLLRQFVWRVSALEDLGVQESFSRGFAMVRENWKNVGLMWIVMIGLGIVWAVISIIAIIITIPVVVVTAAVAVLVSVVPALLMVGFFHLFLSNVLAWVFGALFVLPLFLTVAFSPWLLLGGWQTVFTSTVWTLTYREIKALSNGNNGKVEELPATS